MEKSYMYKLCQKLRSPFNFNKQKYTSCQWGGGNGFFVVNKEEKAIFKKFLSFEHSNGDTSHAKLGTSLYPNKSK